MGKLRWRWWQRRRVSDGEERAKLQDPEEWGAIRAEAMTALTALDGFDAKLVAARKAREIQFGQARMETYPEGD